MRTSRNLVSVISAAVLALAPIAGSAQQGNISIDHVSCIFVADTISIPSNIRLTLRYTNNTDRRVDVSNGFRMFSPDGAVWDSTTAIESAGGTFAAYFDAMFHVGVHSGWSERVDSAGVLGAGTPTSPARRLPVGYTGTPITITLWNVAEMNDGKHICIDSAFYRPGGTWKWVSVNGGIETTYYPTFSGLPGHAYTPGSGYCFYLYQLPCGAAPDRSGNRIATAESGCPCNDCCEGTTGNVNDIGIVDLSDLSALVSYMTGGGYILPCEEEANINNEGIVDLSDLSSLVSYLTGGGYVLPNCP